jgi:putative DNA primase/helicase
MLYLFEDWRARADECDLYETAIKYNAVLKRAGREWIGPCPECGGTNRFAVNQQKHKWNCRGHGGGRGAISMVQHIARLSFLEACEELTGEPNPSGKKSKPLTEAEKAERNRQRLDAQARQRAREAQEAAYLENTREAAQAIWNASTALCDTLGAMYLNNRGIPTPDAWPDCLRFHPSLPYPGKSARYPALICRVDDVMGNLTAIWRIYLRADGRKADVAAAKLGLGPAGGGAVRIGGMGYHVAIAEGVESAMGAWCLLGRKVPVWASLSTSGMMGFEVPLGVSRITVMPDGDRPIRKNGGEYIAAEPAGRKAAQTLFARLTTEGIRCSVAAEPSAGQDYLDLWVASQRDAA